MKTQIKLFKLQLLEELITDSIFINSTNNNRDINVLSRYHENISQEMLFAIEDNDGNFVIQSNNIINTLIFEMNNTKDAKLSRKLKQIELQICIAKVQNVEEEILFRKLIRKS